MFLEEQLCIMRVSFQSYTTSDHQGIKGKIWCDQNSALLKTTNMKTMCRILMARMRWSLSQKTLTDELQQISPPQKRYKRQTFSYIHKYKKLKVEKYIHGVDFVVIICMSFSQVLCFSHPFLLSRSNVWAFR